MMKTMALIFCLLMTGCAADKVFLTGDDLYRQERYDEAAAEYAKALLEKPDKQEYRLRLLDSRSKAALQHYQKGTRRMAEKNYREAVSEFTRATMFDSSLEAARQELKTARRLLDIQEQLQDAQRFYQRKNLEQAQRLLDQVLLADPENGPAKALQETIRTQRRIMLDGVELDVTSTQPITLKFQNADLRDVFAVFSKLTGINFIFDDAVSPRSVSVFLERATFGQALELLQQMNGLDKKVLNEKTIILYPNTVEKKKQYEDQIIQTFYLSNVDAKKILNLLRTMLQLRKIYVHEDLNAVVIRDNPDVIRLAQQIITAADRADSEVVLDLEVVEIGYTDSMDLGATLSTYSIGLGFTDKAGNLVSDVLGGSNGVYLDSLSDVGTLYTLPRVVFDFAKTLGDAEILANPKIRVKNKEKSKVHIGSREPVTTTSTSGDLTYTNVQYIDVGVKLDVEPVIQLDDTVVTNLSLEVSNVSSKSTTSDGTTLLTITTTNAQTTLTLRDGEPTIIGGLIRKDNKTTVNTIPVLGDIPILGRLFSGESKEQVKREILLSVTPHIVRSLDIPSPQVATIWSGEENNFKADSSFASRHKTVTPGRAKDSFYEKAPSDPSTGIGAEPPPRTALLSLQGGDDIRQGDFFVLAVRLDDVSAVSRLPLVISYDPLQLDFIHAQEGTFLKQDGRATVFTSRVDNQLGYVHVENARLDENLPISGSGSVAELTFRARAMGPTALDFVEKEARGPAGKPLDVQAHRLELLIR
ncbi:MAG: type II secretion system protein [Desulfuromonadaceae bacterium]|nr:type II secretion system protein [Desulfuromonadaceae bacterium]